jgi:hypothetical protein
LFGSFIQIHLHMCDGSLTRLLESCVVDVIWSNLCAQAGESAGVGNVGAGLVSTTSTAATGFTASTSTLTTTASTTELATVSATATTLAATEFTAATTASFTTATAALAASASATATTLTGRRSKHTVAIELDVDLLLALALTLGLGTLAGHELLLFLTAQSLALGELLAATLVGLADVLGGKAKLLLGLLD